MHPEGTRPDGTPHGVVPLPYAGTPAKALATLRVAVNLLRGSEGPGPHWRERDGALYDVIDAAQDLVTAVENAERLDQGFVAAFKVADAIAAETGLADASPSVRKKESDGSPDVDRDLLESDGSPDVDRDLLEPWRFRGPGFGPGRERPLVLVDPWAVVVQIHGEEITLEDFSDTDRYGPERFDGTRIVFCYPSGPEPTFEVRVLDTPEEVLAQLELRSGWFDPAEAIRMHINGPVWIQPSGNTRRTHPATDGAS